MSAPSDDGAVRITLRDVYSVVQDTHEAVVEMRGVVTTQGERGDDHEVRLRLLEKRIWALPSIATLLSGVSVVVCVLSVIHSYAH